MVLLAKSSVNSLAAGGVLGRGESGTKILLLPSQQLHVWDF